MKNQRNTKTQIHEEAVQILKTVLLLEKAFSPDYVQRIVTGNKRFPLRNINHEDLETFGSLEDVFFGRVIGIIDYLIKAEMLEVKNPQFGNLAITEKGESWLTNPEELEVDATEVRQVWYQQELSLQLRNVRKDLAEELACEPYELFTNHTMRQIVKHMPETMAELNQIAGMEEAEESVRLLIVAEIGRIMEKKALDDKTGIYTRANYPSHRKVRDLYQAGMAPDEIAKRRKVKLSTVEEYLSTLHRAGHVDLKPYIEETVDNKLLHKASKYFQQAENARLKEAHQVLGIEYDVLRKARTYAAEVWEAPLAYAS